jgi:hypothetical protein
VRDRIRLGHVLLIHDFLVDMQADKRAATQAKQNMQVLHAVQGHQEQQNYQYNPRYDDPESEGNSDMNNENGQSVVSLIL